MDYTFAPDGKLLASPTYDGYVLIWDLRPTDWHPPTAPLSTDNLHALWNTLGDNDAAKAYRAILTLSAQPAQTLPFLTNHLAPVAAERPKRIRQLIAQLDDDTFKEREAASKELARLGPQAESTLRETLTGSPSSELRSRVEPLLKSLEEWVVKDRTILQSVRAIWVLQRIGTPEARAVLEKLATGASAARQTQEAKTTLQFLDRNQKRRGEYEALRRDGDHR